RFHRVPSAAWPAERRVYALRLAHPVGGSGGVRGLDQVGGLPRGACQCRTDQGHLSRTPGLRRFRGAERYPPHAGRGGCLIMRARVAAVELALSAGLSAATAAETGKITVEFNALQQSAEGCRAVFVLNNGLDKSLDKAALRVVAFDGEGHAALFLSLDVG